MPSAALTLAISGWARNECPPSSKNDSSTPARSRDSTSAKIPATVFSRGVRGPRPALRAALPGSGSAAASTLPCGVSGHFRDDDDGGRHHVVRQQPADVVADGVGQGAGVDFAVGSGSGRTDVRPPVAAGTM